MATHDFHAPEALDSKLADLQADLAHFEEHDAEHSPLVQSLRARQQALREKVRAALRKGETWGAVKAEFERDFEALATETTKLIVDSGRHA